MSEQLTIPDGLEYRALQQEVKSELDGDRPTIEVYAAVVNQQAAIMPWTFELIWPNSFDGL